MIIRMTISPEDHDLAVVLLDDLLEVPGLDADRPSLRLLVHRFRDRIPAEPAAAHRLPDVDLILAELVLLLELEVGLLVGGGWLEAGQRRPLVVLAVRRRLAI